MSGDAMFPKPTLPCAAELKNQVLLLYGMVQVRVKYPMSLLVCQSGEVCISQLFLVALTHLFRTLYQSSNAVYRSLVLFPDVLKLAPTSPRSFRLVAFRGPLCPSCPFPIHILRPSVLLLYIFLIHTPTPKFHDSSLKPIIHPPPTDANPCHPPTTSP
jgi:hypothetical protein